MATTRCQCRFAAPLRSNVEMGYCGNSYSHEIDRSPIRTSTPQFERICALDQGWHVSGESGSASNMHCSLSGVSEPEELIQGS